MVSSPGSAPGGRQREGVPFSASAKTYASISPSQNTGMEMPVLAYSMVKTSSQLCGGRPRYSQAERQHDDDDQRRQASSIVIGSRSTIRSVTGWRSGRSAQNPRRDFAYIDAELRGDRLVQAVRWMNSSHTTSVAFSPRVARHGSPGMRRPSAKVANSTPNSTGRLSRRWTM